MFELIEYFSRWTLYTKVLVGMIVLTSVAATVNTLVDKEWSSIVASVVLLAALAWFALGTCLVGEGMV